MALTQLDYTAYRTMQEALHKHLSEVQWAGRFNNPREVGWHDVGAALDDAIAALEAAGYRVVKT